jgi:hypothetical protein
VRYIPSLIAAASILLARFIAYSSSQPDMETDNDDVSPSRVIPLQELWTPDLVHYTGYSIEDLAFCTKRIRHFLSQAGSRKLTAIYTKYKKEDHACVSMSYGAYDESVLPL